MQKNIKKHRGAIEKCNECFTNKQCPKRALIIQNNKNKFHGDINKTLKKRRAILEKYNKIKKGGATYESSRKDTMQNLQITGRTFDKYYKTRNMAVANALESLLK